MHEAWCPIPAFPRYNVSDLGRIENTRTGKILQPTVNQQGILKVNLVDSGYARTRSVNVLVAKAFLPPPHRPDFISAIHLDGDKYNCRANNLEWRPRYYAIRYHQQFKHPQFRSMRIPVIDIHSGVEYETVQQAALAHGLIFTEILAAAHNRTFVWPTYQEFRILS